jgi:hypothetical protein
VRVEFYLSTAMEVSHFAPIVRALRSLDVDAVFVNERSANRFYNVVGWDNPDTIDALLTKLDLPFVKTCKRDADAVITIQPELSVKYYNGIKIRMMYGVGLVAPESVTVHEPPFDFHFVHGPLTRELQFSQYGNATPDLPPERVKVMGYPRFDGWWQEPLHYAGGQLADGKPILLWLPTWGSRSSIPYFADAIFALSDKYNIWVKPHHGTATSECARMEFLSQGPVRMIDFTEPAERSFAAASIVLADLSSGAFSEAVFLKKPVIGLGDAARLLLPDNGAFAIAEEPRFLNKWIKTVHRVVVIASEWDDHWYPQDTLTLRALMFDSSEGADGMRAAKLIIECARLPKLSG